MRVYVPATSVELRRLSVDGAVGGDADTTAFAVTPGLREWYRDDDVEELEYAAMAEAARASLRLVEDEAAAAPRRVVLACDLPDASVTVRDDLDRGVVRIGGTIAIAQVASVHVDDAEAEGAVRVASAAIMAADLGDESAQEVVDDAEGHELAWFATQEIDELLRHLG